MSIGYNIHGQHVNDYAALKDYLSRARPKMLVVMDQSDMALELAAKLPGTDVIYRRWPDHLGDVCSVRREDYTGSGEQVSRVWQDADRWVKLTASYVPDKRILLYALNEPLVHPLTVEWLLGAMTAASALGRRLVVGNFATGTPEVADWRGTLQPLLAGLQGTDHVLGLHEYFDRFDPEYGLTWHVKRFSRIWAVCDELNLDRPKVFVTEHGADSLISDFAGWRRGMSEEEYAEALIWCDREVYHPAGIPTAVFCYGGNTTWRPNYGVEDAPELLARLETYASERQQIERSIAMLQGKGMYIWQVQKCDLGEPQILVALARASQLSHVIFKLADGAYDYPLPAQDPGGRYELMTDAAIRAFQNAGIAVWALVHTQGQNPEMEAHRAASRVRRWRLDGLVVNPQSQYIGQHDKARQFMATVRADLRGAVPIAFSLFRDPDAQDPASWPLERRFPVDEFAAQCDLLMPQVFWISREGGDPAAALRENYAQYRRRYPDKPYVPTGAAFGEQYGSMSWSATPQQLELFLNQARALDLSATNFWSWQHARNDARNPQYTGTQLWDAVARYPWPVPGMDPGESPPPPTEVDPFADGVEVVSPGDSRYLDGIYGRFNTIRFSMMQSEHGQVKYAQTHPTRSTLWGQWVPGINHDGRYEISVWVPGTHATTRRARYHIRGVVGQDSTVVVELDQNRYYDRFVPLGIFELHGSRPDTGAVNLTNLTGETGREVAFSPLRWRLVEGDAPVANVADGYDAPVGTVDERAADTIWPGHWIDAVGFGTRYLDSTNSTAYHTGADLNLNIPRWDSDRDAPVYAIASGTVTFAGLLSVWGEVIVIRHDPDQPDGNPVWARYAHVANKLVRAGDRVVRGQQIAVVGKPAPTNAPYHLHFDISISNVLSESPGHWPRMDYQALVQNYVNPRDFLKTHRPPEHLRGR